MLVALAGALAAVLGNDLTMLRVATGVSALVVLAAVWAARGREQAHERELMLQADARKQDTAVFVDEIGGLRASLERATEQLASYRGKLTEANAELERAAAAEDEAERAVGELEQRLTERHAAAAAASADEPQAERPAQVTLTVEMFESAHAALATLSGDALLTESGDASALAATEPVAAEGEEGAPPWIGVLAVEPGQLWLPGQDGESAQDVPEEDGDEFDVPTLALVVAPALVERDGDVPSLAIELGPAPTYARPAVHLTPARPVAVPAARAVPAESPAGQAEAEQAEPERSEHGGVEQPATEAAGETVAETAADADAAVVDLTAHDQTEALRLPTIKRGRRRA